jgi:hypothetical protein
MEDGKKEGRSLRALFIITVALVVLAAAAWQFDLLNIRGEEGTRTAYEADVVDLSGGEIIVTDPEAPKVEDVAIPETAMTPVLTDEVAPKAKSDAK